MLAPNVQEEVLFLLHIESGKAALHEKLLRPISAEMDWDKQREMWAQIR